MKSSILTFKQSSPKGQQAPVPKCPTPILQKKNRNTMLHISIQVAQSHIKHIDIAKLTTEHGTAFQTDEMQAH